MMNDDFSKLTEDVLYCLRNGLLEDEVGPSILRIYEAGVCDSMIAGMFAQCVSKHKYKQAFYGIIPFKNPQLNNGDYVVGLNENEKKLWSFMQFLNAHTLTAAGSGAGKTMLSRFKILQIARFLDGLFLFDLRKREYRILRKYLVRLRKKLTILRARSPRINPLQLPYGVTISDWIPRVAEMLVMVLGLPPRASKISQAKLFKLYQKFDADSNLFPTLFDLFEEIKKDKEINHQARMAILDSLEPVLLSLGPKVLAWRCGWSTSDLCHRHIVFELAGCSETDKDLILNSIIMSEFCSRISRSVSNPEMDLLVVFDEAQRLCSSSGNSSAIADLIGLVRGTGIGLDMSLQSLNGIHPQILSNSATKILGRCGSHVDYAAMGHSMGLNAEQIHWAQMNLEPGLFIGQFGQGQWRHPFIFRVPPMTFPKNVEDETLPENSFPELKTIYADEFEKWDTTPTIDFSMSADPPAAPASSPVTLFESDQEFSFCKAVVDHPMQPSSLYPPLAGISPNNAKQIRSKLTEKGYIRQHVIDKGSKGRNSIMLEPLQDGITAVKQYREKQ